MTEHNPFDAARVAYEQGQRDAIAAAVQRVEALPGTGSHTPGVGNVLSRAAAIAAVCAT